MTNEIWIDAPVHEQQLAPVLMHHWLTRWSMPDGKSIRVRWLSGDRCGLHKFFKRS
jgi:hypothetical protein